MVSECTRVPPSPLTLQLGDDLHGSNRGRAGDGAGGKAGTESIHRGAFRMQGSSDVGYQMHHVRIALDGHQLGDFYAAGHADAPQVVATEVHQHHVLGALLLASPKLLLHPEIGSLVAPPTPCPGYRPAPY